MRRWWWEVGAFLYHNYSSRPDRAPKAAPQGGVIRQTRSLAFDTQVGTGALQLLRPHPGSGGHNLAPAARLCLAKSARAQVCD